MAVPAIVDVIAQIQIALRLARAQLATRRATTLITSSIVALSFASLVVLLMLPAISGDLAIRHELETLPPAQRSVTIVISPERRPNADERTRFDQTVRRQLSIPGYGPITRVSFFRSLSSPTGAVFRLVGTEHIRSALTLTSGRWPSRCDAERCEVLSVGAASPARSGRGVGTVDLPDVDYIRVVGRATPGSRFAFVGPLAPSTGELLVVADGPDAVQNLRTLDLIRRIDGWDAPIVASEVGRRSVEKLLNAAAEINEKIDISGVAVTVPSDELEDALRRTRSAGATIATSGAELLCLLIVGCAVGGLAARTNHMLAYERLKLRGARRTVLTSYRVFVAALVTIVGLVGGVLVGFVAVSAIASASDVAVRSVILEPWRSGSVIVLVAAGFVLFLILLFTMNDPGERRVLRVGRVRMTDAIAIPTIGAVLYGVRGVQTSASETSFSRAWFSLIVVTCALVWVVVRCLPVVSRIVRNRALKRMPLFATVGTRSASRQHLSLASAALTSVAAAMSVFAVSTATTLEVNTRDQAGFAVPLDYRLRIGSSLLRPDELRNTASWRQLRSKLVDTDVVRRSATLLGETGDASIEVLGVRPPALAAARAWRSDYGPKAADAPALLKSTPPSVVGARMDKGGTYLFAEISGERTALDIAAVLERVDGTWHEIALKEQVGPTSDRTMLRGVLERGDRGGRFLGFRIGVSAFFAQQLEHKIGEGNTFNDAAAAEIRIHSVLLGADIGPDGEQMGVVDGRHLQKIALAASTLRSDRAVLRLRDDDSLDVRVSLQGTSALLLPDEDGNPIPALVDSATAKLAGGIDSTFFVETLQRRIAFRVVALANRFPTAADRFVVADLEAVERQFNLAQPGFGTPTEAWVGLRRESASSELVAQLRDAMQSEPVNQLLVEDRLAIARQLVRDPFRRTSALLLSASLGVALLVAFVGHIVSSRSDVMDQDLFRRTLRLQLVPDRAIANSFAWRSILGVVVAVPLGGLAGVVLVRVAAASIGSGASNEVDGLPLRLIVAGPLTLASVAVLSAALGVASYFGSRSAPTIPVEDLLRGRP